MRRSQADTLASKLRKRGYTIQTVFEGPLGYSLHGTDNAGRPLTPIHTIMAAQALLRKNKLHHGKAP